MDIIFKRRSIRQFTDVPVTDEELHKILRAGFAAPTGHNHQEWQFIAMQDKAQIAAYAEFDKYAGAMGTATAAVLACADLRDEHCKEMGLWQQDIAAAMENMALEAVYLGLASNWIGIYPFDHRVEYCKKVHHLPEYIVPIGLLAIGHAVQERRPIDRYKAHKVHFGVYEEKEEEK